MGLAGPTPWLHRKVVGYSTVCHIARGKMSSTKSASMYRTAVGAAQSEAGRGDEGWNWRYRHALEKRELSLVACREAPHGEHYPNGRALTAPDAIGGPQAWARSFVVWKN